MSYFIYTDLISWFQIETVIERESELEYPCSYFLKLQSSLKLHQGRNQGGG